MKPVIKAEINVTTRATFSDVPCCTKSANGLKNRSALSLNGKTTVRELTSVSLDTCGNLSGANIVEVRNVLSENGLEVSFAKTFCVNFSCVDPNVHVDKCAREHPDTYMEKTKNDERKTLRLSGRETDRCKPGRRHPTQQCV